MKKDPRMLGIGGAPTRVTTLPKDSAGRKTYPIASGFLDYFPDAIAAIAHMSYVATMQHHPDKPMHWDREKSKDEADTMMRHFMQRGTRDEDGERHMTKAAWRSLALLQKEIESEQAPKAEVKDGPYCNTCPFLADFRIDRNNEEPVYACGQCIEQHSNADVANATAMDKF